MAVESHIPQELRHAKSAPCCAGITEAAARELVLGLLRSVQGSEPDLATPLVQAGLDSLGERGTPVQISCPS